MRQLYAPLSDATWASFYLSQAKQTGHGMQGFEGVPYQRGNGLGSFFKGLFRMILPVVKKVGKAVGKEALATGANVAADVARGRQFKESVQEHGRNAAGRMFDTAARKVRGGGMGKRTAKKRKTINVARNSRKKRKTDTTGYGLLDE